MSRGALFLGLKEGITQCSVVPHTTQSEPWSLSLHIQQPPLPHISVHSSPPARPLPRCLRQYRRDRCQHYTPRPRATALCRHLNIQRVRGSREHLEDSRLLITRTFHTSRRGRHSPCSPTRRFFVSTVLRSLEVTRLPAELPQKMIGRYGSLRKTPVIHGYVTGPRRRHIRALLVHPSHEERHVDLSERLSLSTLPLPQSPRQGGFTLRGHENGPARRSGSVLLCPLPFHHRQRCYMLPPGTSSARNKSLSRLSRVSSFSRDSFPRTALPTPPFTSP